MTDRSLRLMRVDDELHRAILFEESANDWLVVNGPGTTVNTLFEQRDIFIDVAARFEAMTDLEYVHHYQRMLGNS